MPSAWTRLRAAVNPYAKRLAGLYSAYPLTPREHIGSTHDLSPADARHYLRQNAYEPQWLSAAKRHPVTNALHDLSYRHVPGEHPPAVDGTALRAWRPRDCQYHVHAFMWDTNRIDWYSHYELRPDLFAPTVDLRRLRTHYRPGPQEYLEGVTNLSL